MSALYHRARPVTFDEVVGQDHVKDVLVSAIGRGRVGHAYLFSGPRGVGKTTTARLLAMAVNCDAPLEQRPCGVCESCRLVQAGAHPDVVELDAASNNSVDDVRDLRERAMLASLRGGTRVWILDEAHMLSKAAANALLKTLEEPPPGLMFMLATTEPERLPPTVLSRCQHFRFRRLTDAEIVGKLARLANGAGVSAETAALDLVARSADGGMRDAESLLDRLLASGEPITLARTEDALGLPPQERLRAMAGALAGADLAALLAEAGSLYRAGFAPRTLAEQLARALRGALHASLAGEAWLQLANDDLLRLLHALDDEQDRFVRHDDLYSLEVALIKAGNALSGNAPAAFAAARADEQAAARPRAQQAAAGQAAGLAAADGPKASQTRTEQPERARARPERAAAEPTAPEPAAAARAEQERNAPERTEAQSTATQRTAPERTEPALSEPARAEAASSEPAPNEPAPEAAAGSFSWHAVRSQADVRLKAFLAPARVENVGNVIRVVFPESNEFHHKQLLMRLEEFTALVTSVAGPGYELVVEGPAGSTRATPAGAAPTGRRGAGVGQAGGDPKKA